MLYAAELTSGVAVAGIERRTGWQKLWPFARSARAPGRGPLRPSTMAASPYYLHTSPIPRLYPACTSPISGLHLPWNRAGRGPRSSSNGARFPGMISPSRPSPTSFETALCLRWPQHQPGPPRYSESPRVRPLFRERSLGRPGGFGRRPSHLLERPRDADSQHQYCRSAGRSSTHAMAGWAQACSSAASTSTAKASGRWPRKAPAWQRRARQPDRPRACPRLGFALARVPFERASRVCPVVYR